MLFSEFRVELKEALKRPSRAREFVDLCRRDLHAGCIRCADPPDRTFPVTSDFVFLVSSTIHPCARPLSYGSVRSLFTDAERLEQTFSTIQSIRDYAPSSQIVLLENSELTEREHRALADRCDTVLRYDEDPTARRLRDGIFKGAGEAYMLLGAFQGMRQADYKLCFKVSGRYRLRELFSVESYSRDLLSFAEGPGPSYSTRLFAVPRQQSEGFTKALRYALARTLAGISLEKALHIGIPHSGVRRLETLGVEGNTGVVGDLIVE